MIGNVGKVDFCAPVTSMDNFITSANPNNTNLNVNSNINPSRNVVSQTGLNSQNLAANTNTKTDANVKANNSGKTNSNTTSSTIIQLGEQGTKMTVKTTKINEKMKLLIKKQMLKKKNHQYIVMIYQYVQSMCFVLTNPNSKLLANIEESGRDRGMYVFIENKDMIAESFAECLGGLVGIAGKNLELK